MANSAPRRPYETTWEDWLLGGGAGGQFHDPTLPLEVEIGPGEDDHLYDSAVAHPEHNWIGIEYSSRRVRKYVRKIERRGVTLPNLRMIWRPAPDLVGPFLSPGVVDTYHIYFPDPWPKAHHERYRLLTPKFATALAESLVPHGRIDLATDSSAYAEQAEAAFSEVAGLGREEIEGYAIERSHQASGRAAPPRRLTVFEERWRSLGRRISFLRFRKEG